MTVREQTLMATRGTVPDTLTIGVVEDDPSFLRALRRLLSGAGFSVATFASAEEFLASESAGETACLVLDVHLGGMNGFDLQQQLATAGRWIPTIFITANDDSVTRERARSGVAYLRKPFREEALVAAIRKALDSRGA
jgi:FixJ family two-component response regulator